MHESALALRLLEPFWTAATAEEEEGAATTTWHPCACERCVYVGLMDACSFMDVRPVLPVGTAPKARGGGRGRCRDPDAGRGVAGGRGAAAAGGRGARVVVRGAPRQHHRGRREGEKEAVMVVNETALLCTSSSAFLEATKLTKTKRPAVAATPTTTTTTTTTSTTDAGGKKKWRACGRAGGRRKKRTALMSEEEKEAAGGEGGAEIPTIVLSL